MKQILIILGLFASVTTFAQSPRIKLNQITKDTVKGSVLISSPTDSGMVYSRDFYIAYGADTVLILYGDTITGGGGLSSVLSDGVTITGDGTTGNELKVDTSLIATISALNDSLATVSASTTADGVTITGDGSGGNPLKVDTLLISTIKALNDTLTNRGYLTSEVDGSISNEGSLTVGAGTASTSVISSNTSGSTDVTLTAGSNITLSEAGNNITIASTGGGTSFNNISETADTVFITGDLNVDANTLRVDATNNRVGIGTSSPQAPLSVVGSIHMLDVDQSDGTDNTLYIYNDDDVDSTAGSTDAEFFMMVGQKGSTSTTEGPYFLMRGNNWSRGLTSQNGRILFAAGTFTSPTQNDGVIDFITNGGSLRIEYDGDVVISDLAGTGTRTVEATSNGTLQAPSTMIIKENIESSLYGISTLKNLNPVTFYYKDKEMYGSVRDIGFLAEEVYSIIPEASGQNADGSYYLDKSKLTAVTVKAIQEQQAIIETQATEIDQLKTLITDLTNRLIILENK